MTVTRHTIKYLEITLYVYKRHINNLLFINLFFGSGRKNVLRKLLRISYRRLKAGFSVW